MRPHLTVRGAAGNRDGERVHGHGWAEGFGHYPILPNIDLAWLARRHHRPFGKPVVGLRTRHGSQNLIIQKILLIIAAKLQEQEQLCNRARSG
jgi:hypothetical protein